MAIIATPVRPAIVIRHTHRYPVFQPQNPRRARGREIIDQRVQAWQAQQHRS